MSNTASGKIGQRLVFSRRKSGQQARFQKAQKIKNISSSQSDQKSLYRVIYACWFSLSSVEKKVFDDEALAENLHMSGWNLFLRKAMADPYLYLGLALFLSMNKQNGATVLDLSKNGYNGTLKPTYPSNVPQYVSSKNSKMLTALSFDGVNDYLVLPASVPRLRITGAISISVWIYVRSLYPAGSGKGTSIFSTWSYLPGAQKGIDLRFFNDSPRIEFNICNGINFTYFRSLKGVPLNQWVHIVATWAPGSSPNAFMYVNKEKTDAYVNFTAIDPGNQIPRIALSYTNIAYANIIIDNLCIYNRVLSPTEVKNLYEQFV